MSGHGLGDDEIILRVTGCPNGCGRAMLAEIGLVGKAIDRYNLYLGGDRIGTRIPRIYRENITEDEILSIIDTPRAAGRVSASRVNPTAIMWCGPA